MSPAPTHLVIVGGIPQKPSKGNRVGDAAQVDEEDGRDGLDVEAIVEVTEEPGQLPLDIQTQATEEPVQDRAQRCFLARTPEQAQGYYESRGVGAEERDLARSGWGRGLSARTFKSGGEFSPDCKSVVASSPPGRVGVDSPDGRGGLMGMCPGVDLT